MQDEPMTSIEAEIHNLQRQVSLLSKQNSRLEARIKALENCSKSICEHEFKLISKDGEYKCCKCGELGWE